MKLGDKVSERDALVEFHLPARPVPIVEQRGIVVLVLDPDAHFGAGVELAVEDAHVELEAILPLPGVLVVKGLEGCASGFGFGGGGESFFGPGLSLL